MKTLVLLVTALAAGIYEAFVIQQMWGWFITTYAGYTEPTLPIIFGVILMKSLLFANYKEADTEDTLKVVLYSFLFSTIALVYGWVTYILFIV